MATSSSSSSRPDPKGLACALAALLLWGLSPIYWKRLSSVPTGETLLHRIVWSAVVLVPWALAFRRQQALAALRDARTLALLAGTTILIGANWYFYLWAVNHERLVEASLGYFICPLLNVALGRLVFGERLSRAQQAAIALAAAAVASLVWAHGRAPWLALLIAGTFSAYAVLRKRARVDAPLGLAVETLLLAAPCLPILAARGLGAFATGGWEIRLLLVGSVVVTGLPLLLYTEGARRLDLTTLGVMQYVAPTCQLLLGAFVYAEPVDPAKARAFALIWLAIALYALDLRAREYSGVVTAPRRTSR